MNDVVLPPWAKGDPKEFIRLHREVRVRVRIMAMVRYERTEDMLLVSTLVLERSSVLSYYHKSYSVPILFTTNKNT